VVVVLRSIRGWIDFAAWQLLDGSLDFLFIYLFLFIYAAWQLLDGSLEENPRAP